MKRMPWKGLLLFVASLFLYPNFVIANSNNKAHLLIDKANSKELGTKQFWLKLLRMENNTFSSGYTSAIHDKEYFLSPKGQQDPQQELVATLNAFFATPPPQLDQHAICRFPARYRWLKKQLQWTGRDSFLEQCPKYKVWTKNGKIKSISLLFASGYFGNPASYFGHPLLKFNTEHVSSKLIDVSLNYGALTPENESPIPYVLKGLFGGYDAAFTDLHFFYHHHNYSETELRDQWEYKLNLTTEEVQLIVDHSWELLGQKISYKFLSDNCALRMAELLEMAFEVKLIPRNHLYAIPIVMYESLATKTRNNGEPLTEKLKYYPSRHSRMTEKYLALSPQQQTIAQKTIQSPELLKTSAYQNLPQYEKTAIIESLMDYYSFRLALQPNNNKIQQDRKAIVLERFKLPVQREDSEQKKSLPLAPHQGQYSFMTRLGYVNGAKLNDSAELTIRPALYDILSPSAARPDNTELNVFDTKIRLNKQKLYLHRLDFFSLAQLNTSKTDLPGDENLAWKIRLALHQQKQTCNNCLVLGLKGGVGKAYAIASKYTAYGLLGGSVQTDKNNYGSLAIIPEVGGIFEFHKSWKVHMKYSYESFLDGVKKELSHFSIETRFGFNQHWDIRFKYSLKEDEQYLLSYAKYW